MGSIGGISAGGSLALGIVVGLLSTSVQSLGLTLQRKSHILEDEKGPHDVRRPPHRRRRWQIGMAMFIVANILGSSVQISTLPLPVLSTLQASGLVFNSICATLILGEPFTTWSMWGTLLVCTGAVLIAVFGAIPSPAHDLSELLELLGRGPFVGWMIFQAFLVVAVIAVTEFVSTFPSKVQSAKFRLGRGLAFGCISGVLSAHSLLVAKSAVELIIKTLVDGDNQFVHWESWVLVLALVSLALIQLYYLHRGLKLVSTSVLYPLVFCVYNIIAILDGLIYFDQTDLITTLQAWLIALGTVILLSGVLSLSWRLHDEQHPPGVGQSSLAPGLGLVEDTEGEEEEVALLDSDVLDQESALSSSQYQTFTTRPPESPLSPGRKKTPLRWEERAEIWDELEDCDDPSSPGNIRRRSTTLPSSERTRLLDSPRRAASGSGSGLGIFSEEALNGDARRPFRRRRKSTGFPGFTARRQRNRAMTLQSAMGGIWKLAWWNRPGTPGTDRDGAGDGGPSSAGGQEGAGGESGQPPV
ncbi:related to DUF803 domain protein [Cephalotrichum gorgonifer]|uniref:Related to DUF803 domain protein n=1 Tax=Cephalotrichum gorgonifer TaxID=2041049 RepID=A0AAE8MVK1_9PEZI|nr:related to DUF803 domain protein [Cephalotrichum gorgonifer]